MNFTGSGQLALKIGLNREALFHVCPLIRREFAVEIIVKLVGIHASERALRPTAQRCNLTGAKQGSHKIGVAVTRTSILQNGWHDVPTDLVADRFKAAVVR